MFINRGLTLSMGLIAGSDPGSLELQFHANTASAGGGVTIPATVQTGDYMLFFDYDRGGSNPPAEAYPSGFDSLFTASSTNTNIRICVSSKIAGPSDAGAGITGLSDTNQAGQQLLVFRPSKPITNVIPQGVFGTSSGNMAAMVATPAGFVPPVLVIGYYAQSGTAVASMTPLTFTIAGVDNFDGMCNVTHAASEASKIKYKLWGTRSSTPEDVTIDLPDWGANGGGMMYIQFE